MAVLQRLADLRCQQLAAIRQRFDADREVMRLLHRAMLVCVLLVCYVSRPSQQSPGQL